jgi:hypothetical protein
MASLEISTLFDEVLDFLASTPTPEKIIAFKPSEALQQRLRYLLDRNQSAGLSVEEQTELDEFSRINHFMSMLKTRARKKFASNLSS